MDYLKRGEVKISTEGYLREVLDDLPKEITGRVKIPSATHLFEVWSGGEQVFLDELHVRAFHHSIAKLFLISTRCSKDIQMAVELLKTQMKAPTEDDWKKPRRLLQYMKCTMRLPMVLSAENLNFIKGWVDASYAAHGDMRGHTGVTMSLGRG